jgi:hypothetical protein
MVEIYDMKTQRALLLMPQQSAYMQRALPPQGIRNPMLPPESSNPCTYVPNAQCKRLAEEALHGRRVTKWEMVLTQDGRPLHSLHWVDAERHMPLRQLWPDGTMMEMQPLDQQVLDGRNTERWELKTTRPDGKSTRSTQWYDPELQIAVREELPGGYFRELRDIKVAAQPEHLFAVPAGYRQVEAPQQPDSPAALQQRAPQPAHPYPGR